MKFTPEIIRERLANRKFNPATPAPDENRIFTIEGQTIGCLNSFVTFSGLPKSGKSTFLAGLVASSAIHHDCLGMLIEPPKDRPKIAYFDTESSQFDFHRQVQRIKNFLYNEALPETIDLFCTREDGPGTNRALITQYLNDTPGCSIVIIDGLLDLIVNYNDERESRLLISWLKKITAKFNILVVTVLHTSKSGEQRLGHLGAGVDRYSQSVIEVVKENNLFTLKPKFLRSSIGFEDIQITFNKESGTYEQIYQGEPAPVNNQDVIKLLEYNRRYTSQELITIIKTHKSRGDNYAKMIIREMKAAKQIERDNKGNYFLLVEF